jgi:hypothetical protein
MPMLTWIAIPFEHNALGPIRADKWPTSGPLNVPCQYKLAHRNGTLLCVGVRTSTA